ncbi:MAG: AAA family ATPase [Prevotella sp.]|nr:AAA family ATPase [Prevotella sp.]
MAQQNPLGNYGNGMSYEDLNVVDFLKLIWDLPTMPSQDDRFRNAEADAYQHMVNNNDWTLEEALLRRFNLLAGDQKYFIKFIEAIVSPEVRDSRENIESFVEVINEGLTNINCELAVQDYMNGQPCYRLMEGKHHDILPKDLNPNTIPIFVDEEPNVYPAFQLTEDTWDDFGYKTRYQLYYYEGADQYHIIGRVRILKRDEAVTYGHLPSRGTSFGNEYCSVGQSLTYYETLKNLLGAKYKDFLNAMRDAAVFSQICDEFCDNYGFKNSLLRYSEAEEAHQYAVYKLAGYSINEPISFIFKAKMPYYENEYLNIKFDMGNIQDEDNLNRIIALIGNNGVGKTTVLSQLAECIVQSADERFAPKRPVFKKVISASYSIFDRFFNVSGSSFNYTYCGIQKRDGGLMSPEEVARRRVESVDLVNKRERKRNLYVYMKMLLPEELVDPLFDDFCTFKEDVYMANHKKYSSGQSMLMNLIIEIVAHIRKNTLILIDEPEVHLHPKGITTFINILNKICKEFASCCILATHSAVIIQELLSRNVIVMDRQGDGSPVVRLMRVESLGENLTTITEDVFGRNEVSPYYKKMVKNLVEKKDSMEEVLQVIQNNEVPVSMPLYILIDKYFTEK